MKRFTRLFTFVLVLAMLTVPTFAQDTSSTPVNNTTLALSYGLVIVLALLLVAAWIFGAYITGWLAKLVPPETAASIYQSGVRFGLQVALNQAGQTPSSLDDEFFEEMASARGLVATKTKNTDGTFSYVLTPKPPASTPPDLPASGAATTYPHSGS